MNRRARPTTNVPRDAAVDLGIEARDKRRREARDSRRAKGASVRSWLALVFGLAAFVGPRAAPLLRPDPPPACSAVLTNLHKLDPARLDGTLPPRRIAYRMRELQAEERRCRW